MTRLPNPGGDDGSWGTLLNDFLLVTHNPDGTVKTGVISEANLDSNVQTKLNATSNGGVSSVNGHTGAVTLIASDVGLGNVNNTTDLNKPISTATQTALNAKASTASLATVATSGSYTDLTNKPTIPTATDATTSTKGVVQLAGDLAGTAAAPTLASTTNVNSIIAGNTTVSGAAQKASNLSDLANTATARMNLGLGSVDNTSDATKNAATATLTNKTISGASNTLSNIPESAVTGLTVDLAAKANTSSLATVATSGSYTDLTNKPTIPTVSDATTSAKGIVQLAGDLAGTAASPTVAKVNGITLSGTPSNGQVLIASGSTAASWSANPSTIPLTVVSVQTAAYNAAVNQLVPADCTSTPFAVTLPTAPADKSRITIKKVDTSANAVTVTAGGSDVFNKAAGSTSVQLSLQNQALTVQYASTSAIWYVVSDDIPLTQLDGRYPLKANNLSDLANAATARTNLGLGNVDNTSDVNKPVSTATQTALNAKADSTSVGSKVLLIANAAALPVGTPAGVVVVVQS